jgi:hypothetical protein
MDRRKRALSWQLDKLKPRIFDIKVMLAARVKPAKLPRHFLENDLDSSAEFGVAAKIDKPSSQSTSVART